MAGIPDKVRALLEGPNYAHLATLMRDGSPHSIVVWAGTEGDRIVIFTQTNTTKSRNLERDPRLAISIADFQQPYRTAIIRGHVVERRTGDEALAVMDRLSQKYIGRPFPYRGPTGILYVIEVDHALYRELPFKHQSGGE